MSNPKSNNVKKVVIFGCFLVVTFLYTTVFARNCQLPKIKNFSQEPITQVDYLARNTAQRTCNTTYKKCLLYFAKISPLNYHAVCSNGTVFKITKEPN